jgi:hypothetical protein
VERKLEPVLKEGPKRQPAIQPAEVQRRRPESPVSAANLPPTEAKAPKEPGLRLTPEERRRVESAMAALGVPLRG